MKEMQYIGYNKARNIYTVRYKGLEKSFKELAAAIQYRNTVAAGKLKSDVVKYRRDYVNHLTFATAWQEFMNWKNPQIKNSTRCNYHSTYILLAHLHNIKLSQITHEKIQDIFSHLQNSYDYRYLKVSYSRLRTMYDYYITHHGYNYNPCKPDIIWRKTKCHSVERMIEQQQNKRRAFTTREEKIFLLRAKELLSYEEYVLFCTYFATGARRGELPAVQVKDIDFTAGILSINKSVARGWDNAGNPIESVTTCKTISSIRSIPLAPKLLMMLYYLCKKKKPDDYVWPYANNDCRKPISISRINRKFQLVRKKAELDSKLCLHCVRHTFCSKLVTAGIDIATVKQLTGHKNVKILLEIYAHSNIDAVRMAMKKAIYQDC